MEQGYEDTRFENTVDRHFHCPICLNVLRDPVQCRRNQHYFCTPCITKHLQEDSRTCPTCKEELTVETLGRPTRLLTDLLSTFKISCDYVDRGCREMVELGALKTHVAGCDFGPVMCSNDECLQVVDRRDKEVHETKVCGFRMVKCDYCSEEIQYMNFKNHRCPIRKEIDEVKLDLSEVKDKLNQLCSAQNEMAKQMKGMITMMDDHMKGSVTKMKQVLQSRYNVCCLLSSLKEDIVIAGGEAKKSVEGFSWSSNTWSLLQDMNQCHSPATSFVYKTHMVVAGGFSSDKKPKMEKMDLTKKNGKWSELPASLPVETCQAHKTVLDQNRLIVIGGLNSEGSSSNTISHVSLTHPYSSKLLTCMPENRCFHGAERINGKIYILGGETSNGITDTVLEYDLIGNSCKEMAPLPFPVSTMATVGWKDNVVVIGGEDQKGRALNTGIVYNVNTGRSTMLPEMGNRRGGCSAVITGNIIVVMGGANEGGVLLNSVECYSFDTNLWVDLAPMVESRYFATAVVKPAQ